MAKMVGLLLMTDLPQLGRVAVLQRRGKFSHERMAWANYAGGCQLTVMGKVNEGERTFFEALCRELRVELGGEHLVAFGLMVLVSKEDFKVWTLYLPYEDFVEFLQKDLKLEPCTGGLEFITKDRLKDVVNLKDYPDGVSNLETIAMFPDEKEAVELVFDI